MDVRDAVEADAPAMADVADAPVDAMRTLVHDRTVRVAVGEDGTGGADGEAGSEAGGEAGSEAGGETGGDAGDAPGGETEADAGTSGDGETETSGDARTGAPGDGETEDGPDPLADDDLRGFVSYDAGRETVHVTQLAGPATVRERLLAEPLRFARAEGMAVEVLTPVDEAATREAAERAGFREAGSGPSFAGRETVVYRMEPG